MMTSHTSRKADTSGYRQIHTDSDEADDDYDSDNVVPQTQRSERIRHNDSTDAAPSIAEVENPDRLVQNVYAYYRRGGLLCMVVEDILQLVQFTFARHDVKPGDSSKRDSSTKWPRSKAGQPDSAHGESLLDTTAILKYLTQYAVLVRGNWVVSSTTLYPDGSKSTRTGVDASVLRRGRDLVLYWFTRAGSLKRMDVASNVRMPAEDLDDVIAQVARPNRVGKTERGGWKFLYETDKSFINRFKDTVNQQAGYWNTRFQILCHELKMKDSDIEKIRRTLHEYEKADVENERRRSGSVSPSLSGGRRRRHSSCGSSASSVMSGTIRRRRNTATMSSDDDTESIGTQPSGASPSRRGRKRKADLE